MNITSIRIPTVLGLGVLVSGLVAGVLLVQQNQSLFTQASPTFAPRNITVANISAHSATIYWTTDSPTTGFVQADPTTSLTTTFKDDRDTNAPNDHQLHFITLTNLFANTTYYYQVTSGSDKYPNQPATFITGPEITNQDYPAVIGTVLGSDQKPINEALITVTLDGSQQLASITKAAGNFVLPFAQIRTAGLDKPFVINQKNAKLKVFDTTTTSEVLIKVPTSEILPPITLGTSSDFTVERPAPDITPALEQYDLNNDKVVNAVDLSIVKNNKNKKTTDGRLTTDEKRVDVNHDGIVDQKDVDLMQDIIERFGS